MNALALDKAAVAAGEWWRLLTVTLVHARGPAPPAPQHVRPVPRRPDRRADLRLEDVRADVRPVRVAGSMASFLFGGPAVRRSGRRARSSGCSGSCSPRPGPTIRCSIARARGLVGQIGMLIVINLVFDFVYNGAGGNIDNAAHIGGLLAGLWLGFVLVPGNVQTVRDLWQAPAGGSASAIAAGGDRSPAAVPRPPAGRPRAADGDRRRRRDRVGSEPVRDARRRQSSERTAVARGGSLSAAQSEASGVSGRITLSRAPCGATFSAMASPPWARASSRTIASPSPVPVPVRLGSPR